MFLKVEQEIQQNHRLVVAICEDHHGCFRPGQRELDHEGPRTF